MRMEQVLIVSMASIVVSCLWGANADNELVIADAGQAKAAVIVSPGATATEKFAAEELAGYLKAITGAAFEVSPTRPEKGSCIFIGKDSAKILDPQVSTDDLGKEGTAIVCNGEHLILTGDSPRGTLYAVYSFLEDIVGCRWWSSKSSLIPKKSKLTVPVINTRYVPPLEYREVFWTDAFDSDWSARNKCNGQAHRLDENRGGKHQYHGFVHTFYPLVPPEKYFAEHPDWFSEIQGKRTHQHTQLCLTNTDMRAELIRNLKAGLKQNPAATIASVSQNDWFGYCRCAACSKIDTDQGSPAGTLIQFVNAVAEETSKDFPNVTIDTLAYQYTRKPPMNIKPTDKVIVRLCSIECSFSVPLEQDRNAAFRDDIQGWSKICDRLYIWDYTTNFNHYFRPHPNLRVLGPNIRFFVRHGVKGIFEQGAYTTLGADMAELRAWMLAKLLWNPNLDDRKLMREFLDGYYGPAASEIEAYLNVIHDSVEKSGYYLACLPGNDPAPSFLTFETLRDGWAHLMAAEKAVANDDVLRNRIQMAQLPVMYAFMRDWKTHRGRCEQLTADWPIDSDPKVVHDRFIEVATKNQVTALCEWQGGFGLLDQALEAAQK